MTIMAVTFKSGRFLQFDTHWVVDPEWNCGGQATFDLICEHGTIKHNWFSMEWCGKNGSGEFYSERKSTQGNRWDHYHMLIDAIENGTELSPNELDGLRYVRIQDAALESIRTGKVVSL